MGFDGMKKGCRVRMRQPGWSGLWLAWLGAGLAFDYAGSALPAPRAIRRVVEWPSTVGTMRT